MKKLRCFTKPKNRDGYYFTPTVDGKTKWIPLGTDKQAALEKYHRLMAGDSRPKTVNEGLDLYLTDGEEINIDLRRASLRPYSDLSEATHIMYGRCAPKIRKEYGNRRLDSLQPDEVTRWIVTLPNGNHCLSLLNNVYSLAKYAGWVQTNPLVGQVNRNAGYERTKRVDTAELQAVYEHASDTLRVFMDIAMRTGLRCKDILEMNPAMIDGDNLVVAVSKTKKKQRVLMFPLEGGLRELVMQTPLKSTKGMPLRYLTLYNWWAAACEAAGVTDLRIHDIRRWAIQQAESKQRGGGQRLADHSSQSQTATYLGGMPVAVETINVRDVFELAA